MGITSRDVRVTPAAGQRMTLGDLREFIAALEAAGAANTTQVDAKVTMRGHLSQLSATAVRFGDNHPDHPRIPDTL